MEKAWKKPKLVILVRGDTNEMVLGTCKMKYGDGPSQTRTGCMNVEGTGACRGHSKT